MIWNLTADYPEVLRQGGDNVADTVPVNVPRATAATISPNPVNVRTTFKISVTVTEAEEQLTPMWYFSGDLYAEEEEA